jgi:predicted SAM-dependent methyltransferase
MIQVYLGAGNIRIPGFVHIDSRNLPGIDYVCSADKLDMFQDNSVDLLYACHILEHFPRRDTQKVLREWYRVLKPGGTLRLAVPDFEAVIKVYQETKNLALLLGHLVGGQDYPGNTHYMVFDFAYLSTLLSEVGFRCIRKWDWRQTIHKDFDDRSQGYYPHLQKDTGILMSLNIEGEK